MEATLFTSFGLLLALMMKKTVPKFHISKQLDLIIYPHYQHSPQQSEPVDKQIVTPQKKKKGKKGKKNNKMQAQQFVLYPRASLGEEQLQKEWKQEKQAKKARCEYIRAQLQALQAMFMEDFQAMAPYNGKTGTYAVNIDIPGTKYSDVPIKIKLPESYPYTLPVLEIGTQNLHPLQLSKLNEMINEHQALFLSIKQSYLHQGDGSSREANKQMYLKQYYPYIMNLCSAIANQLFYNPDQASLELKIPHSGIDKDGNADTSHYKDIHSPNNNESDIMRQGKNDLKKENKKQILQNMVLQILNRDDQERENIVSIQKPLEYNVHKHPNPRGRYKADYQELMMIGEGGFGRVYRCKHRIDSNIYAVKKMVINYNDPQSFKLLKQVAVLSKLNHPNIVRYHQSWLEDTSSVDELIADMMITDPQEIKEFNKIWKKYATEHPSSEDKMIIKELDIEEESGMFHSEEDSVIFGQDVIFGDFSGGYADFKQSIREGEEDGSNFPYDTNSFSKSSLNDKMSRKHSEAYEFPFKILYIVMQYCGSMTLKDFIVNKFNEPNDIKLKLIRGMLQGLSYIHSRRIIHRDLKPANIFLIEDMNKVKIGDFGLATIGNIENNPYQAEIIQYSQKTKGVGTFFYRAPEQVNSCNYDSKIDIYSLGIILLEMFYQFDTNMERYEVLNEVTRTHRLPEDFHKVQNSSQFQQQIQSCISLKPSDRPTVEKLLQTFRNKYFTQLVSLIANPKHFQFYQLMNHLFGIRNETNVIMKQNLYKNYLTYEFTKIYQIHRGVLFTPLSILPVVDYETLNGVKIQASRKEKFLLLSQRGVVMEYPSNAYVTWIRYAKETLKRNIKSEHHYYRQEYIETRKEMRRFTFQKVSQFIGGDSKSQFSFKEKYVTAFDITYAIQNGLIPYYLCQMLKISLLMIETMDLTQRSPPIYLCHSLIYKCLAICYNIPIVNLHKFLLSTTDQRFRSMKLQAKTEQMKKYGIENNIAKKIITLMENQFQNKDQFIESFQQLAKQSSLSKSTGKKQLQLLIQRIQEEIQTTTQSLKIFQLYQKVKWKYQVPGANTFGIFWTVGPVKGFTSIQQYLTGQELCNLHLETSLNPSQQENEAEVSIWSNGEFLEKDIMQVVAKCWENDISAKWYDQNLGEKDLTCRYNIILKKKNERVFMMLRKNYMMFDRLTEKKTSEESKQNAEKQSAFIAKQNFNYEALKHASREYHKKNSGIH